MEDQKNGPGRPPKFLKHLAKDRRGAVALEYGIIVAMIVIALVGMAQLGSTIQTTLYDDLARTFNDNTPGP